MVGLWPPDYRNTHAIVQPKFLLLYNLIMLLFIWLIPAFVSLIKIWGDMILMIDNLQLSLTALITIFKIYVVWHKQKVLAPLIDMLEMDWAKFKMKVERDVMLKHARITRIIATCGLFMIFFTVIITLTFACFGLSIRPVTNMSDPGKPLLIQAYYLHDVSKSPQFELTILAQGFAMLSGGLCYSAVDNFLGLLVTHVCGQLENLNLRLAHMEMYTNFDAALKYNVEDHIRLIKSVQIIDNTFHLMLLGLVFYFGIVFCLQGFLVVNVLKRKGQLPLIQLIWFFLAIAFALLHVCLYCATGEFLVTRSEMIYRAAYKYSWYTIESKAAKNLMLIMLRANQPLYITAGKILPMTMATFCNLLKTSAGYISVLLANQD